MLKPSKSSVIFFLFVVFISSFACRPVLTIGWGEIGILIAILLVLLGPALFKLYKRFDEFQSWKTKKKQEDED